MQTVRRYPPGVRLPFGLAVDYYILPRVDDVILGGLVSYGRWLRHCGRSEGGRYSIMTFTA